MDSHTPMANALGIVGWGVGGIEAGASMLGQPMQMLAPEVIGVELLGINQTRLLRILMYRIFRCSTVGIDGRLIKWIFITGCCVVTIPLTKYQTIAYEIDKIPALTGIGIVLNTNLGSSVIRENNSCLAAGDYLVIDLDAEVASQYDWGNIGQEAGLAAINCSAAVIAALVTFGSTAAAPVTGGTSLALTSIGYAATVATGASCAVSAVRTYNAITDPKTNEIYDNIPAYQTTMKVLDGVSLLGVGASAIAMTKVMKIMGRAGITLGAAKVGSASRPARARLAREVLKYENPAMTNRQVKEYFKLGMGPKRVTTKALTENTILSLRDSLAAGLSFLSSSLDGHVKNAAIYIVRLGD